MSQNRIRIGEGIYKRFDTKNVLTYYITYMDNYGKLKWEKIGKKNDGITPQFCKQLRSKRINQKLLGEDVSKQRRKEIILFDDIAHMHFDMVKTMNKDKNGPIRRYENHIKRYIGNKNVNEITKWDIEQILKIMISGGLMPATVDRVRQTMSVIFNLGIYHEKCKNNPASIARNDHVSIMRRNKKSINNTRERYLSKNEVKELLERLRLRNEDVHLMALLALTTGARANEILSIQFKHINYSSKYITLEETKNGSSRNVKMTPRVYELIKHKKQRGANHYLFKTICDTKFTKIPHSYMIVVNELFNSGLESKDTKNRVVFHTLRHTFASWLALDGIPIYTIQKLMGHRDINMTMRYAKLSHDAGIDAVMDLERKIYE